MTISVLEQMYFAISISQFMAVFIARMHVMVMNLDMGGKDLVEIHSGNLRISLSY